MNKKEEYVAAIDIGTTKIVSIVGTRNESGRIEILGLSRAPSHGVKKGVVLNIEETVNAISTTVEDVKKRSGIDFTEVFVGIAGQHIKSMKSRGYIMRDNYDDEITREEVFRLIEDMHKIHIDIGEEIIHVIPQNFIVDNETGVKSPIGMCGRRLEANFHIVIGQVAAARNIEKCVRKAGLTVKDMILEPLASSEACLTDDEKEAGVALVDIGGGTTDIAVFYDNIIRHTAVIPFGGNVITNDIKEGCGILHRYAEQLKIQYGSALGDLAPDDKVVSIPGISGREPKEISFKSLAYIIQSRMEEIIDAIIFEIQNSGYSDKLAAGMVITGGGAMLKHLPQLIQFKTGMDVRVGLPNEHLAGPGKDEINQPMYATSVGLIMKGFEFLDTYHKKFTAGKKGDFVISEKANVSNYGSDEDAMETVESGQHEERVSLTDKLKALLSRMFEIEDQSIN
ncbi:MAG TPA: cell division protein FtsA [Bacteroidales bacterium]|nr:cell division protein FtsA [Bacteroidales bacterium]HOU96582.1 cell division protein FtsA [Bacteroidales bacterium]HQG36792.1 cell division protein FtsA [Bacteroidales bacterium]HQG53511.1 cell division protein FtsA [Bacteroidales bacterium]HQJ21064.1 cell division protein FtsA [Bacteroidales bacterium]